MSVTTLPFGIRGVFTTLQPFPVVGDTATLQIASCWKTQFAPRDRQVRQYGICSKDLFVRWVFLPKVSQYKLKILAIKWTSQEVSEGISHYMVFYCPPLPPKYRVNDAQVNDDATALHRVQEKGNPELTRDFSHSGMSNYSEAHDTSLPCR